MHNMNAFLKIRANELKLSNKGIAEQFSFSESYVSRVFKDEKMKKDRSTKKMCIALKLDINQMFKEDLVFENCIHKYMNAVYFMESNRLELFSEVMNYYDQYKETPYYIDLLLVEFVQNVVTKKFESKYQKLRENLYLIEKSLTTDERKLFYTFDFFSMQNQFKNDEAAKSYDEAKKLFTSDENLNMMLAYFGFSFSWKNENLKKNIENYYECKKHCEKTKNINRLFNIEIKYAMLLGKNGDIRGALEHELDLLDLLDSKGIKKNRANLINNIAYSYSLMKEYNKAIEFYSQNLDNFLDNDTCFNLAWCYYNVNQKKQAVYYVHQGLNSKNRSAYHYLLLEWLDAMINKKYSKKSFEILSKIQKEFTDSMASEENWFVLMELYNYHHYHHHYEEMFKVGQELLNNNVICTTRIRED